jgi:type IV pilus assembly protein PilY1
VKDKWFAVFGSGPLDFYGYAVGKNGHVYVVDLETGAPYQSSTGIDWLFATAETNAFMNSPVSVDVGLNYNVDAVYFGVTYDTTPSSTHTWKGKLYKVTIPWVTLSGDYDGTDEDNYSDVPNDSDTLKRWKFVPLLDTTRPITSPVALSTDDLKNIWIYVGSGRYIDVTDKTNIDQQYMFGVKDPFFNPAPTNSAYYHEYSVYKEVTIADLLDSDQYVVAIEGGTIVLKDGVYVIKDGTPIVLLDSDKDGSPESSFGSWADLIAAARAKDGLAV